MIVIRYVVLVKTSFLLAGNEPDHHQTETIIILFSFLFEYYHFVLQSLECVWTFDYFERLPVLSVNDVYFLGVSKNKERVTLVIKSKQFDHIVVFTSSHVEWDLFH